MYNEKVEACGKRIEKALVIRKMKQADLCKLAHIPKSSLSLYLRGAYEPKQDRIYQMANVLNVSETWLMGYDTPMERVQPVLNPTELTENEKIMLELFRRVPTSQQMVLIEMVRGALGTQGWFPLP